MANAERERGVAALKEQYDVIEKRNQETAERQAKIKPTPTQAECDLARLGLLDPMEPKEDHGAESEFDARERDARERLESVKREREIAERNMQAARGPGYQTRDAGERQRKPQS